MNSLFVREIAINILEFRFPLGLLGLSKLGNFNNAEIVGVSIGRVKFDSHYWGLENGKRYKFG